MRTQQTLIFLFLVGMIGVGCAVSPMATPVTDPSQRVRFQGFSVLPPKGENWLMAEPPIPDPNWTMRVGFLKRLRERVTRPAEFHTISVYVRSRSLGDVKFESRTELLQYLARELETEHRSEPSVRPLEFKASVDKCLEWDCLRYELTRDDTVSRLFPGSVFTRKAHGFLILHPESPTFLIDIIYTQRYLRGEQPIRLETEAEEFLKGLAFTSLR